MSQSPAAVAREAGRTASPWIERAARMGYVVKGVLYLLIGFLAVQYAMGDRGAPPSGSQEAIRHVQTFPGGDVLLWPVAIGLAGYALWKLIEAITNPERLGIGQRLGLVISTLVHGGLAVAAFRLAVHEPGASAGGHTEQTWTARLLAQPFGAALVGAIGLAVAAYGLWQVARAIAGRLSDLDRASVGGEVRRWTRWLGRAGQAARGFVFGIAGVFLVVAAVRTDPHEARGLGAVLMSVASQPYGHLLLVAVAIGLAAYGVYMLVMARYRRVHAAT